MREHARRFLNLAWQEKERFAKYFISGLGAVGVDGGSYIIFTRFLHWPHLPSNIVCVLLGATWAFLLNKFWSFKAAGNTARQSRRFLILFAGNYILQQTLFYLGVDVLHLHDGIVKVAIMAMVVAWNFFAYRFWVYAME